MCDPQSGVSSPPVLQRPRGLSVSPGSQLPGFTWVSALLCSCLDSHCHSSTGDTTALQGDQIEVFLSIS